MDDHAFRMSFFHTFMVYPTGHHCQLVETSVCQKTKLTCVEPLVLLFLNISKRIAVKLRFLTGWKHSVQIIDNEYTNWKKNIHECYIQYIHSGVNGNAAEKLGYFYGMLVMIYGNDVILSGFINMCWLQPCLYHQHQYRK